MCQHFQSGKQYQFLSAPMNISSKQMQAIRIVNPKPYIIIINK